MEKVRVIARMVAKPGREDALRELLRGMLAPTHAEEGCEIYDLHESDQTGRFYFYEQWSSRAALDRHMETPHFRHLAGVIDEYVSEPIEVNLLTPVVEGS